MIKKIFTHKKIIIIFISAIFIPSLILIYLSYNTFKQRRETTKNILESNLWISGNAALNALEDKIMEVEKSTLKSENFIDLIDGEQFSFKDSYEVLNKNNGTLFLLDSNFNIILPKILDKHPINKFKEVYDAKSTFGKIYQHAESFEFQQKNYLQAIKFYDQSIKSASTKDLRAFALEGKGRCLLALKKFNPAKQIYRQLADNYSHELNKAGHPFGIIAALQLYEISKSENQDEVGLNTLLVLHENIKAGTWLLTLPVFEFFISEIESILNKHAMLAEFSEIKMSYQDAKDMHSPLKEILQLNDFIEQEGKPRFRKMTLAKNTKNTDPKRFVIFKDKHIHLLSYALLLDIEPKQDFYSGLLWDINYIKNNIISEIFNDLKKDPGLILQLIDETGQTIFSSEQIIPTDVVFDLSYRPIPLPWKLLVSHTEMKDIERSAKQEIFIYGVLLIVIIGLMIFGAVLIMRDIYRESEMTRLKTEFVHNISHELKTPLTLIRLYGETLQRKKNLSQKEKEESYQIITKESERLSHQINNVLDFSRIEMGRKEFIFKEDNLANVIQNTLDSFRYHLDKKGFLLKTEIASDIPDSEFDEEALSSVLINLLSNAMKFSTTVKEIMLKLYHDNENIVLQVSDKGIGISQKEMAKIFDRFYRAENKNASKTRGSGLGLTVVKHIIDAHKGQISVQSEPGKGSIFTISLPIKAL